MWYLYVYEWNVSHWLVFKTFQTYLLNTSFGPWGDTIRVTMTIFINEWIKKGIIVICISYVMNNLCMCSKNIDL